ncbi:flagellin lysine-N-methylase [Trabulsiella odontotermitis]|uniref:flagellin lysine-N-methylase n=1 Tax=Trabulsiella odontotermitis TaxID=379893 RepID=UPI0024B80584|nr:flagellin lysine-N-methylase [Trabulsiella odontotermitis]WHP29777.1 flagellin lysine-N-methylase [Trabulsiella odontotermitis]
MKQITITQPKLVTDFSCVGGSCREHCCQGWAITLDKASVRRYQNSKDNAIRHLAQQSIKVTKKSHAAWGEIIFSDGNKNCPFMNSERLCSIHSSLGGDALSDTCATFPRLKRIYKSEIEKGINLSCPEASRLLIADPYAMTMDSTIELHNGFNKAEKASVQTKIIGLFCLNILNIDTLSVEENLYGIVKFLLFAEKLERIDEHFDQLEAVYHVIASDLLNGKIKNELAGVNQNYNLKSAVIFLMQNFFKAKSASRGALVLLEFIKTMDRLFELFADDKKSSAQMAKIETGWQDNAGNMLACHHYAFHNLVKYKFWQSAFPLGNGKNLFSNLYLIVSEFYFIKTLLAGRLYEKGRVTEDDVIDAIYSFHSLTQHNTQTSAQFHQYIESVKFGDDLSLIQLLV